MFFIWSFPVPKLLIFALVTLILEGIVMLLLLPSIYLWWYRDRLFLSFPSIYLGRYCDCCYRYSFFKSLRYCNLYIQVSYRTRSRPVSQTRDALSTNIIKYQIYDCLELPSTTVLLQVRVLLPSTIQVEKKNFVPVVCYHHRYT